MSKVIVQIAAEGTNVYLVGYNNETKELLYRVGDTPEELLTEIPIIEGNKVTVSQLWFHKDFLDKLINLNKN